MKTKIVDRADNFYQIVDAETGEMVRGILFNGRFAFRSGAVEAAIKAGHEVEECDPGEDIGPSHDADMNPRGSF